MDLVEAFKAAEAVSEADRLLLVTVVDSVAMAEDLAEALVVALVVDLVVVLAAVSVDLPFLSKLISCKKSVF